MYQITRLTNNNSQGVHGAVPVPVLVLDTEAEAEVGAEVERADVILAGIPAHGHYLRVTTTDIVQRAPGAYCGLAPLQFPSTNITPQLLNLRAKGVGPRNENPVAPANLPENEAGTGQHLDTGPLIHLDDLTTEVLHL